MPKSKIDRKAQAEVVRLAVEAAARETGIPALAIASTRPKAGKSPAPAAAAALKLAIACAYSAGASTELISRALKLRWDYIFLAVKDNLAACLASRSHRRRFLRCLGRTLSPASAPTPVP